MGIKPVLKEALELCNLILLLPEMIPMYPRFFQTTPELENLLSWLTRSSDLELLVPPNIPQTKELKKDLTSLQDQVTQLICILSKTEEGAKFFLQQAYNAFQQRPHQIISNLCLNLITSEQHAVFFTIHLKAQKLIFQHITTHSPPSYPISIPFKINSILQKVFFVPFFVPSFVQTSLILVEYLER